MPSWLTELLKLLGFTTPFVYAAAALGVFHLLDKKASGPAKKALTARLRSQRPNKETLANYALEVFDRIYSKPLWHWRAFCRSALITTCLTLIFFFELSDSETLEVFAHNKNQRYIIALVVLSNIVGDYCSLFVV